MFKTITVENLESFPKNIEKKAEGSYSITFGDMHANALRMLHDLVVTGVIKIKEQQYKEFVFIYKKIPDELTEDDIINFNNILNKVKPGDNKYSMVRFLGDLLADRGNNDYFILKLLQRLESLGIAYKITLSNHDVEFINSYFNNDFSYVTRDNVICKELYLDYMVSLNGLNSLITRKILKKGKVKLIVKNNVLDKMELISYEVDKNNKTLAIYTHAPIPLESIIKYAVDMKLAESKENKNITLQYVTKLLDELNKHLKENLKSKNNFNNFIRSKINPACCEKNDNHIYYDHQSFDNVYAHATSCYDTEFDKSEHENFSIIYCHGHVGETNSCDNTVNLDTNLGKQYVKGVELRFQIQMGQKNNTEKLRGDSKILQTYDPSEDVFPSFWGAIKRQFKKQDFGDVLGQMTGEFFGLGALGITFFGGEPKVKEVAERSAELQKKGGFWSSWFSGFLNGAFAIHDIINVAKLPINFLTKYEETRITELRKSIPA